jgi:cytoskeletal protein CcmA (bactofilin family)
VKKQDSENIPKAITRFGKETSLKGTLRFSQSVQISGTFEGEIISNGFLFIAEGADVRADIKVGTIIVGGVVHGNIEASGELEMLSSAKIYGNVRTAKLRIADGVVFEGKCEMIKNSNEVDIFSSPANQLKQTIQRA